MMWIISIILIILTVSILKDTHVKAFESWGRKLIKEYDLKLPIWAILLIIFFGSIPILNIVLFTLFIIFYIIAAYSYIGIETVDYNIKVSIKGKRWVTKVLVLLKKLLCAKV